MRGATSPRQALAVCLLAVLFGACDVARAAESVSLHARLAPDVLGASTSITYGFEVSGSSGQLPAPLTSVDIHLPAGMGLGTSALGLSTCEVPALEREGLGGCPSASLLGYGRVVVEVPEAGEAVVESGRVVAVLGPAQGRHLVVLIYVDGEEPVSTQLVFPGEVLSDAPPFGLDLHTPVPLVPVEPFVAGDDVIVTSLQLTIDPPGLVYYEHLGGRLVAYHPRGILVPDRCPRGGFPFALDLGFADGAHQRATSLVGCPADSRPRHRGTR